MNKSVMAFKIMLKIFVATLIFIWFGQTLYAQQGDTIKGKALFNSSCSGCHGINEIKVGPALGVPNPEIEKLGIPYVLSWVNNPKALLDKGDPYAKKIYEKYNNVLMPGFPDIKPEDLHNIKSYIDQEYQKTKLAPNSIAVLKNESTANNDTEKPNGSNSESGIFFVIILFFTFLCLSLLFLILYLLKLIDLLIINVNGN